MGMSGNRRKGDDAAGAGRGSGCDEAAAVHRFQSCGRAGGSASRYPGRALINSISLESEKFEKLLPLAKKYGAMFVLLPLSDEGLPKNLNEKISIIEKLWRARWNWA